MAQACFVRVYMRMFFVLFWTLEFIALSPLASFSPRNGKGIKQRIVPAPKIGF